MLALLCHFELVRPPQDRFFLFRGRPSSVPPVDVRLSCVKPDRRPPPMNSGGWVGECARGPGSSSASESVFLPVRDVVSFVSQFSSLEMSRLIFPSPFDFFFPCPLASGPRSDRRFGLAH